MLECLPIFKHGNEYKITVNCENITISHEHARNVPEQTDMPDGCKYIPNFLSQERANELLAWAQDQEMEEIILMRGRSLKRAPDLPFEK